MKKTIKSIGVLVVTVFLFSTMTATLTSAQSFDAIGILPSDAKQVSLPFKLGLEAWNPELPYPKDIKIGNPWGVIQCERYTTNIGAYAQVSPTTVRVDDRGDGVEEYWVSVVAVNPDSQRYAEVAVDVAYVKSENKWYTTVASIYSDGNWPLGTLKTTYSLGSSSSAPATPSVAVYRSNGNTWVFVVNGYQFDSYAYTSFWVPSKISTAMESYNVPHGWTNGQTIVSNTDIHYKDSTSGYWYTASPSYSFKTPDAFSVAQSTTGSTQIITSTRWW
jgi:hypothetical protein